MDDSELYAREAAQLSEPEKFLVGMGGGIDQAWADLMNVLRLHRPAADEDTERRLSLAPIVGQDPTGLGMGAIGYQVGTSGVVPPIRDFVPTFFHEGASPDQVAERQQWEANFRRQLMHAYNPNQMSQPNTDMLNAMMNYQPQFQGLLGTQNNSGLIGGY